MAMSLVLTRALLNIVRCLLLRILHFCTTHLSRGIFGFSRLRLQFLKLGFWILSKCVDVKGRAVLLLPEDRGGK